MSKKVISNDWVIIHGYFEIIRFNKESCIINKVYIFKKKSLPIKRPDEI
jgi:hypothetical protein